MNNRSFVVKIHTLRAANNIQGAIDSFNDATPEELAVHKKNELFALLEDLANALTPDNAVKLCQTALSIETSLGQRFRKQGLINKSGFARGTVKDIYDLMQTKINEALEDTGKITISDKWVTLGISNKNYFPTALDYFNKALTANPYNANANYELGKLYFLYRNVQKNNVGYTQSQMDNFAIEHYNLAILKNPKTGHFYYFTRAYVKSLNDIPALEDINEAIDLSDLATIDPSYYRLRGSIYAALEEHNKALADFNQAIKLNPNDYENFRRRGAFYEKNMHNLKEAVNDYIIAATLFKAAHPQNSLNLEIYSHLKFALQADGEEFETLSKNDIVKMITDITAILFPQDANELVQRALSKGTLLGKRMHKTELTFGIFGDDNTKSICEKLEALRKPAPTSSHVSSNVYSNHSAGGF